MKSAGQRYPRLPDVAPWPGIQTGPARGRAEGVRVLPGTKTQYSHHRRPGVGVGNPACHHQHRLNGRRDSASCVASPDHWSATDPLTEVPPLGLLPYRPARAQPYFYSDHEIQQLLKAAKARPSM